MNPDKEMKIDKDLSKKKITLMRNFDTDRESVWRAWTEREYLDQWWAPKPWKAESKEMNFKEGGSWLYAMVGPDKARHWAKTEFVTIKPMEFFSARDYFTDKNGNRDMNMPLMRWENTFKPTELGTEVIVEISFESEEDLETIIKTGFQEGIAAAFTNLDSLLEKKIIIKEK